MAKALKEIIVCYFLPSKDFPLVLFSQSATPCNDPFIESNTSSQRLCFACNHVSFSHMIPLIPSTSTASQSLHVEAEKLIFRVLSTRAIAWYIHDYGQLCLVVSSQLNVLVASTMYRCWSWKGHDTLNLLKCLAVVCFISGLWRSFFSPCSAAAVSSP